MPSFGIAKPLLGAVTVTFRSVVRQEPSSLGTLVTTATRRAWAGVTHSVMDGTGGWRGNTALSPFGHRWTLAETLADVASAEWSRRRDDDTMSKTPAR
jgi:hypothetical protein